jgi:hypothetical protein
VSEISLRPQVGLRLSIGLPPDGQSNFPRKLDYFRAKEGSEGQFADTVERFHDKYGDKPKKVDVLLISNEIGDVLDIRWRAWGLSGLKAIGKTNYVYCPERMGDCDDALVTFPEDKPETGEYRMQGPDDDVIAKTGLKLECVFTFAIPDVTGLTTLAQISTSSKRSMLNLLAGVKQLEYLTGGQIAGIRSALLVRPTRIRYFDEKKGKRSTSKTYELIFDNLFTLEDLAEEVGRRRQQMGSGRQMLALPLPDEARVELNRAIEEGRALAAVADRELPADEDTKTRDEPEAVDRPGDALLNRIARLEEELGGQPEAYLFGAFGVASVEDLTAAQAAQYEAGLTRLAEEKAEPVDGEVVDDAQEGEQASFFAIPESARVQS